MHEGLRTIYVGVSHGSLTSELIRVDTIKTEGLI